MLPLDARRFVAAVCVGFLMPMGCSNRQLLRIDPSLPIFNQGEVYLPLACALPFSVDVELESLSVRNGGQRYIVAIDPLVESSYQETHEYPSEIEAREVLPLHNRTYFCIGFTQVEILLKGSSYVTCWASR